MLFIRWLLLTCPHQTQRWETAFSSSQQHVWKYDIDMQIKELIPRNNHSWELSWISGSQNFLLFLYLLSQVNVNNLKNHTSINSPSISTLLRRSLSPIDIQVAGREVLLLYWPLYRLIDSWNPVAQKNLIVSRAHARIPDGKAVSTCDSTSLPAESSSLLHVQQQNPVHIMLCQPQCISFLQPILWYMQRKSLPPNLISWEQLFGQEHTHTHKQLP